MAVQEHKAFGQIICSDWNEFYASKLIKFSYFDEAVRVRLVEYDEDFEPLDNMPSLDTLDEYAQTLESFVEHIDTIISSVQTVAFERYNNIYAKYYENPFKVIFDNEKIQKAGDGSLHEPLNINSKEQHFEYMNSGLGEILISNNQTIVMPFRYLLDQEHGLECKIKRNQVVAVGGIAETIYE